MAMRPAGQPPFPEDWRVASPVLLHQHVVTCLIHAGRRDIPTAEVWRTCIFIAFQAVCLGARRDGLPGLFIHTSRDRHRWRRAAALWQPVILSLKGVTLLHQARCAALGLLDDERRTMMIALERLFDRGYATTADRYTAAFLQHAPWLCH